MALNEPEIPVVEGDLPEDPAEIQAKTTNKPEDGKPNAAKPGEADDKKNEESSFLTKEQHDKLIEGWKEDREYFNSEIKRLRSEATNLHLTKKEEDELENIDDPDERAEKKFEFKQKRKEAADKAELEAVKSEIRFYKRTSPEFADNEKDIIAVATKYECKSLDQAILIWRGLNSSKAKKDEEYNDKRKKGADGGAGGKAGGKPAGAPIESKKPDSKKSFGDFYREAGIK